MGNIKTIFIVGILVLIFPMFGFPASFENGLLIIFGILLILSSLNLRKQIPHVKEAPKESTSFSENGGPKAKEEKEEDVIEEVEIAEHEEEVMDERKF